MVGVHVLAISAEGGETHSIMDDTRPLLHGHVPIWADNLEPSTNVLRCRPPGIRDCPQRNRLPIAHCSERDPSGHVHYIEFDHVISDKYGVTMHRLINRTVDPEVALREPLIDAAPMWW
ncbi:hypothetical protein AB0M20_17600 [Actinoplanes sp. NPDC051633]|uniref:hypothetical protein n=1 Tax=Actinoplanes sp. NPDC051633 TaxID=3155670 RepID=UPI0034364723